MKSKTHITASSSVSLGNPKDSMAPSNTSTLPSKGPKVRLILVSLYYSRLALSRPVKPTNPVRIINIKNN